MQVENIELENKILKHLSHTPTPISTIAQTMRISYITARKHILNLVIKAKIKEIKISGIKMYFVDPSLS